MLRRLVLTGLVCVTVTGCARIAESRLNPMNWFGRSQAVAAQPQEIRPLVPEGRRVVTVDQRVLIDTVTDVRIERMPDGAIIRATGYGATGGSYNAELVLESADGGNLVYAFRVMPSNTAGGRRVTVATVLTNSELAATRSVTVRGATGAQRTSR